jgi:hypothetical protein
VQTFQKSSVFHGLLHFIQGRDCKGFLYLKLFLSLILVSCHNTGSLSKSN